MPIAWSPIFAAVFFFTASVLRLINYILHLNRSHYDDQAQRELDPDYIKQEWKMREDNNALNSSANVLNAIAWVLFAIPVMQVSWVLSRGGVRKPRVHGAMVGFTLAGVVTELVARFLLFGAKSSSLWLAKTFNLNTWLPESLNYAERDDIGWRALEVNYRVIRGLITYVDAFEWVSLFIVLCLISYSVGSMQNRVLNIWWARFGLLVAFLCLFDLAAALLLLFDRQDYMKFAVGIGVINMLLFLPAYLIILAYTLPNALPHYQPTTTAEPRA